MPYPPLSLLKRLVLGRPLTPSEEDTNKTDIEVGVNAQRAQLAVALNPDGTLKAGSVSTIALQDRVVTQDKLDFQALFYVVDSGGANAMVVSFTPAFTAYAAGDIFWVKAAAGNSGATTINANSAGLKSVKTFTGGALAELAPGQILSGNIYEMVYDGVQFIVLNPSNPSAVFGPVFLPLPVDLNPGGTVPMPWTDVDLSGSGPVPPTAKAVILVAVNQVTIGTDGQVFTEVKPDNAGSAAQIACQMGGVHGTGTESSQQGIYPIGLVAGVPHIWFRVTNTASVATAFLKLVGYVM